MTNQSDQQEWPTVGLQVLYTLTEGDAAAINADRDPAGNADKVGNTAHAGDVLPAVVVHVFDPTITTCNLQVFLDGEGTYWATSRMEGDEPGTWRAFGVVDLADVADVPDPDPAHAQP